ncbi:MAG: hypothetical protein KAT74_07210, partial [Candidatus Cloacimonetes bacterium]|nr:hypothetical protein [Candidatus Cloacimonadota bacterium]
MKILLLFSFIILLNFSLISTIINIPADQPTIQQGIDVSVDGDTVLVQPGTYVENINYNGKNITVSSLFLTTQDTTYISQTLIDGNQNGSVVTFESEEDTTAVLCGFIITNGNSENYGGGIFCSFSNPCIKNVIIEDNYAAESGGGLFFSSIGNSYINLENVIISSNFSNSYGGGISAHSNLHCENVIITCNTAYNCGGGIYSRDNLNLVNVTVSFNCTFGNGGGIYQSGFINFENTIVTNNTAYNSGGGIYYAGGIPQIKNVIIKNNIAYESGGGIFFYDIVDANFNIDDRCSIYMNNVIYQRGYGVDIYSLQGDNQYDIINVVVDTFSTFSPTDYYVFPIDAFTFDILHSIQDSLINSDLYVSVDGDDNNSGISESEPLRTIKHALSRIFADSLNQNTIYLLPGIYSSSTNGEIFPINWSNYVSLDGINEEETILDADTSSCVMKFNYVTDAIIKNVTIRNGYAENGGGIFCEYSNPTFENIIITENNVSHYGGGIYCKYSNPNLENVTISNNNAVCRGGGIYCWFSNPILTNVSVTYNSAEGHYSSDGGGIFCYQSSPSLENVTISNNSAIDDGGGIYCSTSSNPILQNAEISDNTIVGGSGFANG